MKLYVDLKGDRHFLVTEDGEAVYVDELQEEGRDTEYLEQAIEDAWRRPKKAKAGKRAKPLEVETFGSDRDTPE